MSPAYASPRGQPAQAPRVSVRIRHSHGKDRLADWGLSLPT